MKVMLIIPTIALVLASCHPESNSSGNGNANAENQVNAEIVDGKVKFYLSVPEGSAREHMGIAPGDFSGYVIRVNGADYEPVAGDDGKSYVLVEKSAGKEYLAVARRGDVAVQWYGENPYSDIILPYSQFYGTTATEMAGFPMYASYSEETGGNLEFVDGFALIDIEMKGTASITSVKLRADGARLAGKAAYLPSKGQLSFDSGADFVVLNCTMDGENVPLSGSGTHFCIPVAPGNYPGGIEMTICDASHRMQKKTLAIASLAGGDVETVSMDYSPDADLLWYEGFDNFTWGGDIMHGASGYAPDSKTPGIDGATDRTGYENAFYEVGCSCPGSGFIQSNTWNDVSGKTVGTSHQMSDSYIRSRGLSDYAYMFRVKEWQGCVSVGKGNSYRGIMQTPAIGNIDGISDISASFLFCFQEGSTDDLDFEVMNGGRIKSIRIDGSEMALGSGNSGFTGAGSWFTISRDNIGVPDSETSVKQWHKAEVEISDATSGTCFYFAGKSTAAGTHGVYVDEITATAGKGYERGSNTLRVLYWNIQNGMWADQANNYQNFTEWVQKYDPDVCVWCEAKTIYYDNTSTARPSDDRYLPSGWAEVAARYGHSHVATGGERDNFPQEITSKYPITTLKRITDSDVDGKPISHGAGLHSITVNGKEIYIVTLHTWPQTYGYGVASADREASTAKNEGDYYREFELRYIMSQTVNNPEYASQVNWLVMGDFNSRSRYDNWYMGYPDDDTRLLAQDVMINGTTLKDIIHEQYPDCMISTTGGTARIDYMWASPSMYGTVDKALILTDKWTAPYISSYVSSFYYPSDHRPILVDFDLSR